MNLRKDHWQRTNDEILCELIAVNIIIYITCEIRDRGRENKIITVNNGYLGSYNDEERS